MLCMLMRRRKEEASKDKQTTIKAKQHSTPKIVTFPKKNKLARVGLEPTTLYTLYRQSTLPAELPPAELCACLQKAVLEVNCINKHITRHLWTDFLSKQLELWR